jgi:tRNA(His) 5'-end guanylyltransferase
MVSSCDHFKEFILKKGGGMGIVFIFSSEYSVICKESQIRRQGRLT